MRRLLLSFSMLLAAPALAAQAAPTDSVFVRAQQLVAEGQGAAGRAVVDSALAARAPTSPEYAEALFWRASLAGTAEDAQRDYLRVAIEYPLSPRAEDSLMRLAQLELARGDRAQAMHHLERLVLEHPTGAARPRANYWMARVLFEQGDAARACAALRSARESSGEDVELRNQVAYYDQRCARVAEGGTDAGSVAGTRDSGLGTGAAGTPSTPAAGRTRSAAGGSVSSAPGASARPRAAAGYTAQVAAYATRRPADALAQKLRGRGYAARVVSAGGKYRVRVGRYRTREQALDQARRLKRAKIDAFVVESEPR